LAWRHLFAYFIGNPSPVFFAFVIDSIKTIRELGSRKMTTTEFVQQVVAKTADGKSFTICVYQRVANLQLMSSGARVSHGANYELLTADGLDVQHLAKGRYRIVGAQDGPIATSDDPDAF
jgi:hypothetical protein